MPGHRRRTVPDDVPGGVRVDAAARPACGAPRMSSRWGEGVPRGTRSCRGRTCSTWNPPPRGRPACSTWNPLWHLGSCRRAGTCHITLLVSGSACSGRDEGFPRRQRRLVALTSPGRRRGHLSRWRSRTWSSGSTWNRAADPLGPSSSPMHRFAEPLNALRLASVDHPTWRPRRPRGMWRHVRCGRSRVARGHDRADDTSENGKVGAGPPLADDIGQRARPVPRGTSGGDVRGVDIGSDR